MNDLRAALKNDHESKIKKVEAEYKQIIDQLQIQIKELELKNNTLNAELIEVKINAQVNSAQESVSQHEVEIALLNEKKTLVEVMCDHDKELLKLMRYESCTLNDNDVRYFTGIVSKSVFDSIFEYFKPMAKSMRYWNGRNVEIRKSEEITPAKRSKILKIDLRNQFFLTLCRLRRGYEVKELAHFFAISESYVTKIFITWCTLIHAEIPTLFPMPTLERVVTHLPQYIKNKYPNLYGILDCTEFKVETPSSLVAQSSTYSSYKSHNTFKVLYMTSPTGMFLFVSDTFSGKTSDKEIVLQSKVLDLIPPKSHLLVDRGFEITHECAVRDITVDIPAFKGTRQQLSAEEVWLTEKIANCRVHVERCIRRVRTSHFFDGDLHLSMSTTLPMVIKVASFMQNFLTPVIKQQ